jgi:hypothetical protein
LILALAILGEIARRRKQLLALVRERKVAELVIFLAACVGVLWITLAMIGGYRQDKAALIEDLSANRARIVEGYVQEYRRQAWSGKPMESFRVGTELFKFDGFGRSPAYHRRAQQGGQLRDGLHVRVWEIEGEIVRLEVVTRDSVPK